MWEIVRDSEVENVSLAPPGAKKGVRIIKLESLLAHLNSLVRHGVR